MAPYGAVVAVTDMSSSCEINCEIMAYSHLLSYNYRLMCYIA